MKKLKEFLRKTTMAPYLHLEAVIAIPLVIWFVWRVETIIRLLSR